MMNNVHNQRNYELKILLLKEFLNEQCIFLLPIDNDLYRDIIILHIYLN